MILSILIPTTLDRAPMFTKLYNELHRQHEYMKTFHPSLGGIEILVDDSKSFLDGGLSIGKKRESLVHRAQGKFCCFIDSDDMIPGIYMESLVRACQEDVDIVTFKALARLKEFWTIVEMSLYYVNEQVNPSRDIYRSPSIVCPVRTSIAKSVEFEDINWGEDYKWIDQVVEMCSNEEHLSMILYEYRHGAHSESDKIIKAGYV